jgi:hypothetical protein
VPIQGVTAAGARATPVASAAGADLQAFARAAIVRIPLLVAVYARQRLTHARFGRVLIAVSALWFVASLAASASALLYSVGRVAAWLTDSALVYMLLAFPNGRLRTRFDRVMMASASSLVAVLYVPTVLLVRTCPTPSPWSTCYRACPHNAFMVLGAQPGMIGSFVNPVRELLTVVIFLIVGLGFAKRIRHANSLLAGTLAPVPAMAIFRLVGYSAGFVARRVDRAPR